MINLLFNQSANLRKIKFIGGFYVSKKVVIMGAAGRDFHNFNLYFRDNKDYEVIAFTATQIPDIAGRKYPKELAGKLYPKGIPIYDEKELPKLIKDKKLML